MMISYTLGFLFNTDLSKILLIHKLTPEWQAGKVNGLGGKFEAGESAQECIAREVREEADLQTNPTDWKKVGELKSSTFRVDVMTFVYTGDEAVARSMEEQEVEWFPVSQLPISIMPNLSWLIPLCKDFLHHKEIEKVDVTYTF